MAEKPQRVFYENRGDGSIETVHTKVSSTGSEWEERRMKEKEENTVKDVFGRHVLLAVDRLQTMETYEGDIYEEDQWKDSRCDEKKYLGVLIYENLERLARLAKRDQKMVERFFADFFSQADTVQYSERLGLGSGLGADEISAKLAHLYAISAPPDILHIPDDMFVEMLAAHARWESARQIEFRQEATEFLERFKQEVPSLKERGIIFLDILYRSQRGVSVS
ncbi:MAG: hypothetical protein AAB932_03815, partial [Patescibacteria group bacterium]